MAALGVAWALVRSVRASVSESGEEPELVRGRVVRVTDAVEQLPGAPPSRRSARPEVRVRTSRWRVQAEGGDDPAVGTRAGRRGREHACRRW